MTYAPATRPFYDADSHIMELPDFLKAYADPELREAIPEVQLLRLDRHRRGGGGDRGPGRPAQRRARRRADRASATS